MGGRKPATWLLFFLLSAPQVPTWVGRAAQLLEWEESRKCKSGKSPGSVNGGRVSAWPSLHFNIESEVEKKEKPKHVHVYSCVASVSYI